MPDNFDLHETTDSELEALMADLAEFDDAPWVDDVDPWLMDEEFDAW